MVAEHILDDLVPDMVEQTVKLPKTVSDEQNPGADCGAYRRRHSSSCKVCRGTGGSLQGVSPMDRIQQRFVEQTNETLDVLPSLRRSVELGLSLRRKKGRNRL